MKGGVTSAPLYRKPKEIARRLTGSVLELGIKAYGTAAIASVVLSDSETVGGKLYDAAAALPNLAERYRQARYLLEHAEEIQAALDYVNQHAPDSQQIQSSVQKTYEALTGVQTAFGEIERAKEALSNFSFAEALEHLGGALGAAPDLGSITHLAEVANEVTPALGYLNSLEIDFASLYQGTLSIADNFARDEIAGTLGVIIGVFGIAFALATGFGFWGRRGRPGMIVRTLQGWGARLFPEWYTRYLESALGEPLYTLSRKRIQADIVTDPQKALDPEAYRKLEQYFERRLTMKEVVQYREASR